MTARTAPTVYDSGDTGAPQLVIPIGSQVIATQQAVLAVIKACLVGTSGTAYGSKSSAGWTLAYDSSTDATNPRMALRQGNPTTNAGVDGGSNGLYIRIEAGGLSGALGQPYGTVQLNVAAAGTAGIGRRFVRVRGYETMSSVDAGTNPFPNLSQQPESSSLSYYWAWATGANSIASPTASITIPWTIVADDRFFYIRFFAGTGINSTTDCSVTTYFFGDLVQSNPSMTDLYDTIIYANSDVSTTAATAGTLQLPNANTNSATTTSHFHPFCGSGAQGSPGANAPQTAFAQQPNLYICRPWSQAGTPINVGMHTDYYKCSDLFGNGNLDYPEKITGSLMLSKVFVHEPSSGFMIRGFLPGCWVPCHTRPLADMVYYTGTGVFNTYTLLSMRNARTYYDLNSYNIMLISNAAWNTTP